VKDFRQRTAEETSHALGLGHNKEPWAVDDGVRTAAGERLMVVAHGGAGRGMVSTKDRGGAGHGGAAEKGSCGARRTATARRGRDSEEVRLLWRRGAARLRRRDRLGLGLKAAMADEKEDGKRSRCTVKRGSDPLFTG
jgi:hypothetical protein